MNKSAGLEPWYWCTQSKNYTECWHASVCCKSTFSSTESSSTSTAHHFHQKEFGLCNFVYLCVVCTFLYLCVCTLYHFDVTSNICFVKPCTLYKLILQVYLHLQFFSLFQLYYPFLDDIGCCCLWFAWILIDRFWF